MLAKYSTELTCLALPKFLDSTRNGGSPLKRPPQLNAQLGLLQEFAAAGAVTFDWEAILRVQYSKLIKPGHTVFDVGAHTGRHLKHFIELVGPAGRVVAFEPLPFAAGEIRAAYTAQNVQVHEIALSDEIGDREFLYVEGTPEESGFLEKIYNFPAVAKPRPISVKVDRLDKFAADLETLDFVKLDVEGAEINCLNGAIDTLARLRPVLSIEYGYPAYNAYNHTKYTLFDLLETHRYRLFDLFGTPFTDRDCWSQACDSIYWDFLAAPEDRREEIAATLAAARSA